MLKLYTIRDTVVGNCGMFFTAHSDAEARRSVRVGLNNNPFIKDMQLMCVPCSLDEYAMTICTSAASVSGFSFVCNVSDCFNESDDVIPDDALMEEVSNV